MNFCKYVLPASLFISVWFVYRWMVRTVDMNKNWIRFYPVWFNLFFIHYPFSMWTMPEKCTKKNSIFSFFLRTSKLLSFLIAAKIKIQKRCYYYRYFLKRNRHRNCYLVKKRISFYFCNISMDVWFLIFPFEFVSNGIHLLWTFLDNQYYLLLNWNMSVKFILKKEIQTIKQAIKTFIPSFHYQINFLGDLLSKFLFPYHYQKSK